MRKIIILLTALFLLTGLSFVFTNTVLAKDKAVKLYLFYRDGCPHCADEEAFLENLREKYPELEVKTYEIWRNKKNQELMKEFASGFGVNIFGVPATFIGDKFISGYLDDDTTGREIETIIKQYLENGCPDAQEVARVSVPEEPSCPEGTDKTIKYPFIGEINLLKLSLPVLTIVLGTLDGFNPCAMWVLMFLIALLINSGSKKKMWLIGGTFIFVSGIVYYLFMAAWLNVFLFIGYLTIVRVLIGAGAVLVGIIHIRDFFTRKDNECKVIGASATRRQKITERIKKIVTPNIMPATFLGVIALAFAVNLIELLCSAGLPAIYTGVLAMSNLSAWQYYLYLLFYIILYMLDDTILFVIAAVTLSAVGFKGKFARRMTLVGGLLILILGILLIFKPDILMFG